MTKIYKINKKSDCNRYLEFVFIIDIEKEKFDNLQLYFLDAYTAYICQSLIYNFKVNISYF